FTGASLNLGGTPSLGTQQIQQPGATAGSPDLALTKTGPADTSPGQVISYTINFQNKASAASTANGVQLKDVLPVGVTYLPGSCTGSCILVGNTITWDLGSPPSGSLAPGASGTRSYKVT